MISDVSTGMSKMVHYFSLTLGEFSMFETVTYFLFLLLLLHYIVLLESAFINT